jgi:hypothetical protein
MPSDDMIILKIIKNLLNISDLTLVAELLLNVACKCFLQFSILRHVKTNLKFYENKHYSDFNINGNILRYCPERG